MRGGRRTPVVGWSDDGRRVKLAERARPCPACGRREPPDAPWCGDCGAPLARGPGPTVLRVGDAPDSVEDAPPRRPALRRSTLAAGVAVLVVAVAGVLAEPTVVGDPDLLGRIDETTGRTSLLPPFDDLQPLWRRPVELGTAPVPVPRLHDLGGTVLVGGRSTSPRPVRWPTDVVPSPDGRVLLVSGDEVVVADAVTGAVRQRRALVGADGWRPVGPTLGWVAGAAVLPGTGGALGAVAPDGTVRWVGDPAWTWDGTGDGTDWLVVTSTGGAVDRLLVVDGRDGTVHRDVGPAGVVHAPVVQGDTLAWVDPYGSRDLGLGQPVEVHGLRLDGTGRVWAVTDLPPTSGAPDAVALTAVEGAVVVHYWSAGQSTAAVWLDPVDGSRVGEVVVSGTGRTDDGWPVAAVTTDGIVHVSPVRQEVRFVDRGGRVRWSQPTRADEGVLADGGVVLRRTPHWQTSAVAAQGSLLETRLRLLDALTGDLLADRVTDDVAARRFVGVLRGLVGVSDAAGPVPLAQQLWLEPGSGRRSAGTGLAAALLDEAGDAARDAVLLGRVQVGASVRPVFALPDGRLLGIDPSELGPTLAQLLAPVGAGGAPSTPTLVDGDLAVEVGAAAVTATTGGRTAWRATTPVVLDTDLAVLTSSLVVVAGRDGSLRAWGRDDGVRRWVRDDDHVTALTAGGDELVVGTDDGRVRVLDEDGAVLQDVRAGRMPVDDVAVVDGQVLVATGAHVVGFGRGAFFVEPADRVEVP